MEEKNVTKISLSMFFLILAIIVIIVMGIFIYKLNNAKNIETQKSADLQTQVNNLNETVSNLQGKINGISKTINFDNSDKNTTTNNDDITYTISTRAEIGTEDETYATIKATKDGKTVSKEFDIGDLIDKYGTMYIKGIGTVALVSSSAGEGCIVSVYQLVNDEIKLLGTIDCGADMVEEATYTVDISNESIAVINAKRNSETIKHEFEISANIANTSVIDIFDYGKVVLVAETGSEYYGIQVYRLSQDYITGKTEGIRNVGSIQHNI